ncbi:glycosyltransferase family 4 protein [Shewanella sp. SM101]|uniref:glycosyltransferase family 4 protein n=1 Tax=Shewanella sp. SM101 TaxID=2912789 RepID=UPI0021D9EF5C|nr:glycosyltransferase family 4 protein [Shewanella sp. SM101]MCU8107426.1 glycosyltransferase family 4 protein [Shewanella sp. SM101]
MSKNHTIALSANTCWYVYNFRKNTIISLLNNGYRVVVIAPEDEYTKKVRDLGCAFIHVKIDQGGSNPIKDLSTLYSFFSIFKNNRIDIILNFTPKNNIYSTLAANFFGVKAINNIAGLGILFINESWVSKIARFLYRLSQSQAEFIFFQNEDDKTIFSLKKIALNTPKDRLPGSGVDLKRFKVIPAIDDGKVRFLLIARMLFDKGIGHYIGAARLLREKYGDKVEFRLLGFLDVSNPSSVSKVQMEAWVAEGIVEYLGVSDSVESEIAEVDCMVLPSFYREGVPKSLLEAGAMGKPIVTTDNVGCRETVEHGVNGFLCDVRSTESLTKSLDKMIRLTHEERLMMGQASRAKIEREFDEKIVLDKYLAVIKKILKEN